jgi:hypothetical protein
MKESDVADNEVEEIVKVRICSSTSGNTTAGSANSSGSTSSGEQKTYTAANIKASYSASFDNLQAQAEARLSSLVGRAASEYKTKKAKSSFFPSFFYYINYFMSAIIKIQKTSAGKRTPSKLMVISNTKH